MSNGRRGFEISRLIGPAKPAHEIDVPNSWCSWIGNIRNQICGDRHNRHSLILDSDTVKRGRKSLEIWLIDRNLVHYRFVAGLQLETSRYSIVPEQFDRFVLSTSHINQGLGCFRASAALIVWQDCPAGIATATSQDNTIFVPSKSNRKRTSSSPARRIACLSLLRSLA